jgi:hypothetical protein
MLKEPNNSRASPVSVSYEFMKHLRKNLIVNMYGELDNGSKYINLTIAYRTEDGKIHQVANTRTAV